MKYLTLLALCLCLSVPAFGAQRVHVDKTIDQEAGLSSSRLLKAQFEEARKLSAKLTELATEVEYELDKNGENVLPLTTLKKLEEIEKIAKKLRDRLKQ